MTKPHTRARTTFFVKRQKMPALYVYQHGNQKKKQKNDCAPSTDPISSVLIQIIAPAGEGWFMIISRSLEVFFDFSFFLFFFSFFYINIISSLP